MRSDRATPSALPQIEAELAEICRLLTAFASSPRGTAVVEDLRVAVGGTGSDVVWQALLADCLRVVYSAMLADGEIEDREIAAVNSIIAKAARHYAARPRSLYAEFVGTDPQSLRDFLDCYAADRGPFGRCSRTRWQGLMLCRRAAELGERSPLQRYAKAMASLISEASRVGGVSEQEDPNARDQADELHELKRMLASDITASAGVDRRVQAFLAPCRAFSAVQQASSIFENDPFDVEAVHRDARASFDRLVTQATMRSYVHDRSQMLMVLGDSGAGKTHLLRGFRHHVQEGNRGFVAYAQLQSRTSDYSRYLLFHLVESLSRRYSDQSGRTGLHEMASGLLRLARQPLRERLERLANDTWDSRGNITQHVDELVDELLGIRELANFDRDLLRVMVYALRPDPKTTSSVYKYLHCDAMNEHDRAPIGGIAPRTRDSDPHIMLCGLGRFAGVTQRALVVMVDQIELAGFETESTTIFRGALDALYRIVSEVPSAVVVVACLSDLYNTARAGLTRSMLDRLEQASSTAKLQINRSYAEIEAVVARRLSWLFAEHGTVHRPDQPVYPIPASELRQLENRRLRDVLEWCHQFQAQCATAGKIINADEPVEVIPKVREVDLDQIAAAWSEAIQAKDFEVPTEDDDILAVIAEAAKAYAHETGLSLDSASTKKEVLRLQMSLGEEQAALAISVVNESYHGGAFPNALESLRKRSKGAFPIAIRTLEFQRGRACDKAVGQLTNVGGRPVYLDASTLRTLVAFHRFQPAFPGDRIIAWKLRDRPISSLPAVLEIFDFDRSRSAAPAIPVRPSGERVPTATASDPYEEVTVTTTASSAQVETPPPPPTPTPREASAPKFRGAADAATAPLPAKPKPSPEAARRAKAAGMARGSRPPGELDPPAQGVPTRSMEPIAEPATARPLAVSAPPLRVGTSTSFEAEPILLEPAALLRHVGVVDAVGSGRIAAAMNLVEQMLERGVPAIVLDRTGEMTGYARPDWWQRSPSQSRARRLADQIEPRLFTPGIRGGRPLSVSVIPDLSSVPPADHDREIRTSAAALLATLRASESGNEAARLAVLTDAIAILARQSPRGGLPELIELIENGVDDATRARGDHTLRQDLNDDLSALLGNVDVFTPGAESLTAATLVGPGPDGRVPLAIIHTGFLGNGPRLRAWVAQLIGAVSRELASYPSRVLQTLLVLDGVDLLLPTTARNALAKEPLQELLKRAGAAGLGLVLASQRPIELDYRRCGPVETWFVGRSDDATLRGMASLFDQHPLGHRNPSRLEPARHIMLHGGNARDVERPSPLLAIDRPGEAELKALAARTHPRLREAVPVRRTEAATDESRPVQAPPR